MYSNVIALFPFLTVALGAKADPYKGYPIPFFPEAVSIGADAPKGSAPWHVSLQYGYTDPTHFCSGAIVNPNWVITSGHCAFNIPNYGNLVAVAGLQDLSSPENTTQSRNVVSTFIHEQYIGQAGPNDIALLKVSPAFKTDTDAVKAITLPKDNNQPSGNVSLTSWGSTWRTYFPYVPNKLQLLSLNLMNLIDCQDAVRSFTSPTSVTTNNVCTRALDDGFTACNSDPGSPLTAKQPSTTTLEGIVSWGIVPCGTKGVPLIYTRVSAYNSWIKNVISKN